MHSNSSVSIVKKSGVFLFKDFLNSKVNLYIVKKRNLLEESLSIVLHKIPSHFVSLIVSI